jgi:hypothetical protein
LHGDIREIDFPRFDRHEPIIFNLGLDESGLVEQRYRHTRLLQRAHIVVVAEPIEHQLGDAQCHILVGVGAQDAQHLLDFGGFFVCFRLLQILDQIFRHQRNLEAGAVAHQNRVVGIVDHPARGGGFHQLEPVAVGPLGELFAVDDLQCKQAHHQNGKDQKDAPSKEEHGQCGGIAPTAFFVHDCYKS